MADFDFLSLLPNASFGGIAFPWAKYSVQGGLRHHPHEYMHRPGAEVEPLGRKPYKFKFSGDWHAGMRGWETFFPGQARALRELCETEQTYALVVPDLGTVQCKAIDWPYTIEAKKRSGQSFEWEFLEDASNAFVVAKVVSLALNGMTPQLAAIVQACVDVGYPVQNLAILIDAVGTFQALDILDDLAIVALEAAAFAIIEACIALDGDPFMAAPAAYPLTNAIHEIWYSALVVRQDALRKAQPLLTFVTPNVMTITQVAIELYKSTTRTVELLGLNALDDALAIPPGKFIRYYPPLRKAA